MKYSRTDEIHWKSFYDHDLRYSIYDSCLRPLFFCLLLPRTVKETLEYSATCFIALTSVLLACLFWKMLKINSSMNPYNILSFYSMIQKLQLFLGYILHPNCLCPQLSDAQLLLFGQWIYLQMHSIFYFAIIFAKREARIR